MRRRHICTNASLRDKPISAIYLPKGEPLKPGERVVQAEYAETLTAISTHGEDALYHGPLGDILVDYMTRHGGFIRKEDLTSYETVERLPIRTVLATLPSVAPWHA